MALLGAGDDRYVWNPGDGGAVVEGQDGVDTLAFNGSSAGETIAILANGPRVLVTRESGRSPWTSAVSRNRDKRR